MFPRMVMIEQNISAKKINNIEDEVCRSLRDIKVENMKIRDKIIGITVGSRGIRNISLILKIISDYIKAAGGNPVLIPSMGTHGGSTLNGQSDILNGLGITEKTTGAEIHCCIDTILLGETPSGVPVYCNKEAVKMDGIVVVNRVKAHTDFSGEIESGLCKMFAIGLGGERGAYTVHSNAIINGYEKVITETAEVMIEKLPVLFGVGILENWKNETSEIKAFLPKEIIEKEKQMLIKYKESAIKLPFDNIDVLIVGEIGKNISGTGMDTNIIGRIHIKGQIEPTEPVIGRIVVLNLTDESHGNAVGIGLADITTMKVFKSIDLYKTGFNSITSMAPEQGFIPCVVANDKAALEAAINTLGAVDFSEIRMVYIKNTSTIDKMYVSESLIEEVRSNNCLSIIEELGELNFDASGNLINLI